MHNFKNSGDFISVLFFLYSVKGLGPLPIHIWKHIPIRSLCGCYQPHLFLLQVRIPGESTTERTPSLKYNLRIS